MGGCVLLTVLLSFAFALDTRSLAQDVAAGDADKDDAATTAVSDAPVEIVSCRVGFDGMFKVGLWTPVEVELRTIDSPATVQVYFHVADGDGVQCRYPLPADRPVQLTTVAMTRALGYVRFGRRDASLRVTVNGDDHTLTERTFSCHASRAEDQIPEALGSKSRLWVTVGGEMGAREAAKVQQTGRAADVIEAVRLDAVDQLPTRWYGYEGVDAVLLATSQPEIYRKLSASAARIDALDRWVRLGGRLLLSVGSEAAEVLAADAPLARFLRAAPGPTDSIRLGADILQRFETYSETGLRLITPGRETAASVPQLSDVVGRVEARVADLPLVVRQPYGLGEVVFVAVELDRAPFAGWQARGALVSRLMGLTTKARDDAELAAVASQATQPGYDDLSGKIRGRLDEFESVQLLPFWQVALLIVGYILLIGPIDYLLVHKLIGRAEWTWLSFPMMVVIACGGAYALGSSFKGDRLLLNQIDLVDVDVESGQVRGTCWFNVFSPAMAHYDVTASVAAPMSSADASECLTSWMGLPGGGLGGMDANSSPLADASQSYETAGDYDQLSGVPIAVWSTKSFTSRWRGDAATSVTSDLTLGPDNVLSGRIDNQLNVDLADCHLVYSPASGAGGGRLTAWTYPLGTLTAGDSVSVDRRSDRVDAQTWLKDLQLVKDQRENKYGFSSAPFDPTTYDPPRDLRTMMFYQAVGGEGYSKLMNRYQSFVDLTDALKTGRAILVGRGEAPTTKINVTSPSGQATLQQNWVFYRFLLPMNDAQN
jgi:hypothetical protein